MNIEKGAKLSNLTIITPPYSVDLVVEQIVGQDIGLSKLLIYNVFPKL